MDKEEYMVIRLGSLLRSLRYQAKRLFNVADDLYRSFCEFYKIPDSIYEKEGE